VYPSPPHNTGSRHHSTPLPNPAENRSRSQWERRGREKALAQGSEFLGEGVLFTIAVLATAWEYKVSADKAALAKRDQAEREVTAARCGSTPPSFPARPGRAWNREGEGTEGGRE
jgi:hypothetical protein